MRWSGGWSSGAEAVLNQSIAEGRRDWVFRLFRPFRGASPLYFSRKVFILLALISKVLLLKYLGPAFSLGLLIYSSLLQFSNLGGTGLQVGAVYFCWCKYFSLFYLGRCLSGLFGSVGLTACLGFEVRLEHTASRSIRRY